MWLQRDFPAKTEPCNRTKFYTEFLTVRRICIVPLQLTVLRIPMLYKCLWILKCSGSGLFSARHIRILAAWGQRSALPGRAHNPVDFEKIPEGSRRSKSYEMVSKLLHTCFLFYFIWINIVYCTFLLLIYVVEFFVDETSEFISLTEFDSYF
jgi:hypothetical protein